ncbi:MULTISPECIES: hypothetical protein [unclassified Corynebacterium]|uniref:hypothetical protein n=1 Tax=unclassified Corynebacterium TaxID=2624378 RepID=UPI0029CA8007|nr:MULTISPECIES: hypothetical protein [unclassified Corynebacterium]WPF65399.1 hypothetical protein OLX12_07385 [Corynebacterium sp. 22KM0430]WPF67894.1 hypothetical protein OLW90_07375 [Corynebacterium sp. 21KM1197]
MTIALASPPLLLRPSLLLRQSEEGPLLDEAYGRAPAAIMLSRDFASGLFLGEQPAAHDDIAALGMSLHQAWDRSAAQLLSTAQRTQGTQFRTRAASALHPHFRGQPVWQVDCPGSPATAWLAHPYPFTVLHRHLTSLGSGAQPWYFAPRPDILLAAPQGTEVDLSVIPVRLCAHPIGYRHGFPTLFPGSVGRSVGHSRPQG